MRRPILLALCATLVPAAVWAETAAAIFVAVRDVTVLEGDTGTTNFSAELQLSWHEPVTVNVSAVPGSATSEDFVFAPVRLTLVPGQPQTVTGQIIGDRVFEGNHTFRLQVTSAADAGPPWNLYSSGGVVTIQDDDQGTASRLRATGIQVKEGANGAIKRELTVALEPASAMPVSVTFATMDGTATAPSDYQMRAGTLELAPGETSKIIDLEVVGDDRWENDERFVVRFRDPRGAILLTEQVEVVIENDDAPVTLMADDVVVAEGNQGRKVVPVVIRWVGPAPEKIHVAPEAGSADGGDYLGEFRVLYPEPGSTSASYQLEIVGDTDPECDEGILLAYAVAGASEGRREVRVLIKDDDGTPPAACAEPFRPWPPRVDGGAPPKDVPDAGAPEAGTPPRPAHDAGGAVSERRGGCSVAAGAAGAPPLLLVVAGLALAWRRRRAR